MDNYQNYRNLGEYDNVPTDDSSENTQCLHDNTIDVGDADHQIIYCTDCKEPADVDRKYEE